MPRPLNAVVAARAVVAAVAAVVAAVAVVGLGCVVPIRDTPGPPDPTVYVDPHGRPRAFGGGVCPLRGRHLHAYPPVPPAAFVLVGDAWRDQRPRLAFRGPHVWRSGRCSLPSWHEHVVVTAPASR
jgi:hypothetical protein